jgi:hypothetical protein
MGLITTHGYQAQAWLLVMLAIGLARPASAQSPGSGKQPVAPSAPVTVDYYTDVLQTLAVSPTAAGLPELPREITSAARCFVGSAAGPVPGSFVPLRYVGNVLCIDPGPNGDFQSFLCAADCPPDSVPVLQGVTLRKIEPLVPKCPDVYPGHDLMLTPQNGGIRTWFPLKHTPPGTEFLLSFEVALVRPSGFTTRQVPFEVRIRNYHLRVTVTPDTLAWVVHALHNEPLGVCEVPCITDEGLFDLLLRQADTIRGKGVPVAAALRRIDLARESGSTTDLRAAQTALNDLQSTVVELNTALDVMEATIAARTLFMVSVWRTEQGAGGALTRVVPCALFPNDGLWGNFTVADFGWGIVDTLENPCACKLIADLYYLKQQLIGVDP